MFFQQGGLMNCHRPFDPAAVKGGSNPNGGF